MDVPIQLIFSEFIVFFEVPGHLGVNERFTKIGPCGANIISAITHNFSELTILSKKRTIRDSK